MKFAELCNNFGLRETTGADASEYPKRTGLAS